MGRRPVRRGLYSDERFAFPCRARHGRCGGRSVRCCCAGLRRRCEPCPKPANLPPANSPVLIRCIAARRAPGQRDDRRTGDLPTTTSRRRRRIRPSRSVAPYDEEALKADFWSLWRTGFLDNLWIEVIDEPFENGVAAKHVIYHIEERSRAQGRRLRAGAKAPRPRSTVAKIEDHAARAQHPPEPGRVRRRSDDPESQGRHPRGLCGEGLQRRQDRAEARSRCPPGPSSST